MKLIYIGLIIIFLFIVSFMMSKPQQDEYRPSKGKQLVNSILAKTTKIIKEKYSIKPCGAGVAMPGGPIQELTLCFTAKSSYTKEQLRELVIKLAQELLNQVNENDEIQEFLKDQPFTIKNIQIIIYNHDKNNMDLQDPEISTAQILEGILTYRTNDPQNSFKFKNEFEETYEEALKALATP